MNKAELILNKIAWGSIVWGSPTELEICKRRIMIEAKEKRGAFVNQKEDWSFPKISYGFSQDVELKRNSEDEKVERDFLYDKA